MFNWLKRLKRRKAAPRPLTERERMIIEREESESRRQAMPSNISGVPGPIRANLGGQLQDAAPGIAISKHVVQPPNAKDE